MLCGQARLRFDKAANMNSLLSIGAGEHRLQAAARRTRTMNSRWRRPALADYFDDPLTAINFDSAENSFISRFFLKRVLWLPSPRMSSTWPTGSSHTPKEKAGSSI